MQHAAAAQPLAVGVEQVRRPVQRDRGLAGARPALHDQRAGQVAADHLVLLGLDGRDDVAHPAGAVRADRGQQGALAGQRAALRLVHRVQVERLVLDAGDAAAAGREVPPAYDVTGGGGGRLVELAGRRRPPVDQQLGLLVVGEPEAADVAAGAVAQVDPAERQPVLDGLQLGQPLLVQAGEGVALRAVLVGADWAGCAARWPARRRCGPAGRPGARTAGRRSSARGRPRPDSLVADPLRRDRPSCRTTCDRSTGSPAGTGRPSCRRR